MIFSLKTSSFLENYLQKQLLSKKFILKTKKSNIAYAAKKRNKSQEVVLYQN
jgi:hypothetical protein